MEPKFTKGKWIVSYGANSHVFEGLLHVNGEAIAFVDYESPNAHLIAAAPDMYAALEGICEAYRLLCDDTGKPYYQSQASRYAYAIETLSRARGETK